MKKAAYCGAILLISMALLLQCGCMSPYGKGYSGPTLGTNAVAIVYNDTESGVYLQGSSVDMSGRHKPMAYLPGKQDFTFDYRKSVPGGYYRSTKPFILKETVQAGHQYQVIGYSGIMSFSASLVDITTPDDVWKYYEMGVNENHQKMAVDKLADQEKLKKVLQSNPKPAVRSEAAYKITDTAVLKSALDNEIDADVRDAIKWHLEELARVVPGSK